MAAVAGNPVFEASACGNVSCTMLNSNLRGGKTSGSPVPAVHRENLVHHSATFADSTDTWCRQAVRVGAHSDKRS